MDYQGFTSSNCELICFIYEAALAQGWEADWRAVGEGLYYVEVFYISEDDFEQMVYDVKALRQAA